MTKTATPLWCCDTASGMEFKLVTPPLRLVPWTWYNNAPPPSPLSQQWWQHHDNISKPPPPRWWQWPCHDAVMASAPPPWGLAQQWWCCCCHNSISKPPPPWRQQWPCHDAAMAAPQMWGLAWLCHLYHHHTTMMTMTMTPRWHWQTATAIRLQWHQCHHHGAWHDDPTSTTTTTTTTLSLPPPRQHRKTTITMMMIRMAPLWRCDGISSITMGLGMTMPPPPQWQRQQWPYCDTMKALAAPPLVPWGMAQQCHLHCHNDDNNAATTMAFVPSDLLIHPPFRAPFMHPWLCPPSLCVKKKLS